MEANELRINNYVSVSEIYVSEGDLLQLNQKVFEVLILNKSYDRIFPIPLTDEWLIKLGFEKDNDSKYRLTDSDDEVFYIKFGEDPAICIDEFGVLQYIDHVHELQNVYAALGIKELKLIND